MNVSLLKRLEDKMTDTISLVRALEESLMFRGNNYGDLKGVATILKERCENHLSMIQACNEGESA